MGRISGKALIVLLLACSSDGVLAPDPRYPYANAMSECIARGRSITISLTQDNGPVVHTPYIRINLFEDLPEFLVGRSWKVDGSDPDGVAWAQMQDLFFVRAASGFVAVSSVEKDRTVVGRADITIEDGGHIAGGFRAEWRGPIQVCSG